MGFLLGLPDSKTLQVKTYPMPLIQFDKPRKISTSQLKYLEILIDRNERERGERFFKFNRAQKLVGRPFRFLYELTLKECDLLIKTLRKELGDTEN